MPADIGVHDLTSNTSHSPFVVSATSFFFGNDPYKAFDSGAGNSFWIGTGGGVDKLQLDRGNANAGTDLTPHDLTTDSSHSPIVISASSAFGGFPEWHALDGNTTTSYWLGTGSGVDWWKIDFGSGVTHIIRSYWITVNNIPEPNRAPKNWTFEGSNDNSSWTTLHTVTNQTSWDNNATRYFEPTDVSTAYRYFRINITANNGDATYTQLCEVYLFDTAQDRTRSKVLGSYKIKVVTTATRCPKDFKLQGNKFEGGGWVDLDTRTGETSWTNNEERTYTCAGGGSTYQAFRLNITANNGDGTYTEVGELTLLEGATTVNESVTMDVSAGFTPANTIAALESRSLDLTMDFAAANQLAALNSVSLDISSGITAANTIAALNSVALGVSSGITPHDNIAVTELVTIGIGSLGMAPIRFQFADGTIGVALGMSVIDALGNETPGVFRSGPTSGQAGIFRAIDAGDETPGVFRPATEAGTPGRFKPID